MPVACPSTGQHHLSAGEGCVILSRCSRQASGSFSTHLPSALLSESPRSRESLETFLGDTGEKQGIRQTVARLCLHSVVKKHTRAGSCRAPALGRAELVGWGDCLGLCGAAVARPAPHGASAV